MKWDQQGLPPPGQGKERRLKWEESIARVGQDRKVVSA